MGDRHRENHRRRQTAVNSSPTAPPLPATATTSPSSRSPWPTRTASWFRARKNLVHFSISGPGEIVATDNGDATDLTAFSTHDRKAFNGLALAIVKAKRGQRGTITVTAKSEGLKSASTTIKLK